MDIERLFKKYKEGNEKACQQQGSNPLRGDNSKRLFLRDIVISEGGGSYYHGWKWGRILFQSVANSFLIQLYRVIIKAIGKG